MCKRCKRRSKRRKSFSPTDNVRIGLGRSDLLHEHVDRTADAGRDFVRCTHPSGPACAPMSDRTSRDRARQHGRRVRHVAHHRARLRVRASRAPGTEARRSTHSARNKRETTHTCTRPTTCKRPARDALRARCGSLGSRRRGARRQAHWGIEPQRLLHCNRRSTSCGPQMNLATVAAATVASAPSPSPSPSSPPSLPVEDREEEAPRAHSRAGTQLARGPSPGRTVRESSCAARRRRRKFCTKK